MTFKQLEQFLRAEILRAGARSESDFCGKYARCAYCDRFCEYPCAYAYDTLMRKMKAGKPVVATPMLPEPDVRGKFGTVFASEDGAFSASSDTAFKALPAPSGGFTEAVKDGRGDRTGVGFISLKSRKQKGTRVLVIRRGAADKSL